MILHDIGILIASRDFDLVDGGKVTLVIGKPQLFHNGQDHFCPYQISGMATTGCIGPAVSTRYKPSR